MKVKTKVSTSYRSEEGASIFVKLRSEVDTAVKNGFDIRNAFLSIAQAPKYTAE